MFVELCKTQCICTLLILITFHIYNSSYQHLKNSNYSNPRVWELLELNSIFNSFFTLQILYSFGWSMCRSCTYCHLHCDFICVPALLFLENTFSLMLSTSSDSKVNSFLSFFLNIYFIRFTTQPLFPLLLLIPNPSHHFLSAPHLPIPSSSSVSI